MRCYCVAEFGEPLQRMERPTPQPKGTEVLVRVSHCGVCHTDVHLWHGYYDLGDGKKLELSGRGVKPPFTPGHEMFGEVVSVGPEAPESVDWAPWCRVSLGRLWQLCALSRRG